MDIRLKLDGAQPSALRLNETYTFDVYVNDRPVLPDSWAAYLGGTLFAEGFGTSITFSPNQLLTLDLHVRATDAYGNSSSSVFSYSVSTRPVGMAALYVTWNKPFYAVGDVIRCSITSIDPEGLPVSQLQWTLRLNNEVKLTGGNSSVTYSCAQPGLWRLVVTGKDFYGAALTSESSVSVEPSRLRRDTAAPEPVDGSLVYLGAAYSELLSTQSGTATALPYKLATFHGTSQLIPGTTHVIFGLDSSVDDEVVIRTHTGNYAIRGSLTGEDVGYDYKPNAPNAPLPAPLDLSLSYAVDVLNTSQYLYGSNSFRVIVRCYCKIPVLYRYTPCPYSYHPGGEAPRNRRWSLVFSALEVEAAGVTTTYTTPEPTSIPNTGMPAGTSLGEGNALLSYTESNRCAVYAGERIAGLDAKAVSCVEGVRPYSFSLQDSANRPNFCRIKRLKGTASVYVNGAYLPAGTVIWVVLHTSLTDQAYTLTLDSDHYNPDSNTYLKVGSVALDVSDYQFDFTGVTAHVSAVLPVSTPEMPTVVPTPSAGPDYVYAALVGGVVAPAVIFDGACYGSPVRADIVDTEYTAVVTAISSCADPACGPTGIYCYHAICDPATCIQVTQPLHSPAPCVASVTEPMHGYDTPAFQGEGTIAGDYLGVDPALCGDGYRYQRCNATDDIIVVYPCSASPHPFVYYDSNCYALQTAVTTFGTITTILPVAVLAVVSSCSDYLCTKANPSGDAYVYFDAETGAKVPVKFDGLWIGIPTYGVAHALEFKSTSIAEGSSTLKFSEASRLEIMRCNGSGRVELRVGAGHVTRTLLIYRDNAYTSTVLNVGESKLILDLLDGDVLYLDISKYGSFPARLRNLVAAVSWSDCTSVPYLYDSVYATLTGSQSISAIAFTGYADQMPYRIFDNLPADVEQSAVNPDSLVTVTGIDVATPEYALIRSRAFGEFEPVLPDVQWYAGQSFTGKVKFNFYALRSTRMAAHGEMDVWFSADATFPDYLLAPPYRALEKRSDSYRCDSAAFDANRNVFKASASIDGASTQSVYVASDGQCISSKASATQIAVSGKSFTKLDLDKGLSRSVLSDDVEIVWAHISDYGFDYPTRIDTANLVRSFNPSFIVAAGDNWQSGSTNTLSSIDNKVGAYYHDYLYPYTGTYGAPASEQRFFAGVGNHDHTPPGGGAINPSTYRLPGFKAYFNVSDVNYEVVKWPVHFFFIDNTDYAVGSLAEDGPTALWLKAKLQASTAPWKVVVLHYPPWCSGAGHVAYTGLRWPYRSWGADLLISGHVHVYERFLLPDGLVAIACGTCNPAYWAETNVNNVWRSPAVTGSAYGYGITPQKAATCRFRASAHALTVDYIDVSQTTLDSVTLNR